MDETTDESKTEQRKLVAEQLEVVRAQTPRHGCHGAFAHC